MEEVAGLSPAGTTREISSIGRVSVCHTEGCGIMLRISLHLNQRRIQMTDFEKLKEIAKKEFGVTLIQSEKKSSFKELFGFDMKDLEEKK